MKAWLTAPMIIVVIAAMGLLLFLAVFIQGRASDSTSVTVANQELSDAQKIVETVAVEPWRNDVGTWAIQQAAQTKIAEQAAETARIAEEARQEAARQEAAIQAVSTEQSCEELMAAWEARYAGVPSAGRTGMPCGPNAGYSSAWTAGQAQWEAMSEEEKIAFARAHGGTYGQ